MSTEGETPPSAKKQKKKEEKAGIEGGTLVQREITEPKVFEEDLWRPCAEMVVPHAEFFSVLLPPQRKRTSSSAMTGDPLRVKLGDVVQAVIIGTVRDAVVSGITCNSKRTEISLGLIFIDGKGRVTSTDVTAAAIRGMSTSNEDVRKTLRKALDNWFTATGQARRKMVTESWESMPDAKRKEVCIQAMHDELERLHPTQTEEEEKLKELKAKIEKKEAVLAAIIESTKSLQDEAKGLKEPRSTTWGPMIEKLGEAEKVQQDKELDDAMKVQSVQIEHITEGFSLFSRAFNSALGIPQI